MELDAKAVAALLPEGFPKGAATLGGFFGLLSHGFAAEAGIMTPAIEGAHVRLASGQEGGDAFAPARAPGRSVSQPEVYSGAEPAATRRRA